MAKREQVIMKRTGAAADFGAEVLNLLRTEEVH
jgi:hypothetical protein